MGVICKSQSLYVFSEWKLFWHWKRDKCKQKIKYQIEKKICHLKRVLQKANFTFFNMPSLMNSRPGVSNLGADLSKHFWMLSIFWKFSCCLMWLLMWVAMSLTFFTASTNVLPPCFKSNWYQIIKINMDSIKIF